MTKYNFLKDENDNFQKEINRTLKFEKYIAKKKNPYNGENAKRDETFREIISHYKAKGIKIPDLSTDKNLFKPSALLIDDAGLKHYFQVKKGEKDQKGFEEKDSFFISKVNNLLHHRLQELDSRGDTQGDPGSQIRKDPSKFRKQTYAENIESNIYQTNMLKNNSPLNISDDNIDLIEEEINLKN